MTYTLTDSPIASHTLAQDQPLMEANNLYFTNALAKDHQIVLGHTNMTTFEGRHIQVALNNRHGAAPTVAGVGDGTNAILYSDNGNLFYGSVTGAGAFQLTTYNSGSNFGGNSFSSGQTVSGGWTFLPGGLILQYGVANIQNSPGATTVTYPIAFPSGNPAFMVQCTAIVTSTSSSDQTASIRQTLGNSTSFTAGSTSTGNVIKFSWMAIGN